jgi:hypothetical protein
MCATVVLILCSVVPSAWEERDGRPCLLANVLLNPRECLFRIRLGGLALGDSGP